MRCSKYHREQHDYTFNFWRGCHKVHEGCKNCYAYLSGLAKMRGDDPNVVIRNAASTWKHPFTWQRKAKRGHRLRSVFACSSSDFFLEDADAWRPEAWKVIKDTQTLSGSFPLSVFTE